MIRSLSDWLDDRTGIRQILHESLYETIPGGARWRYVWGSTLVFAFLVQMITGSVLWMAYSPSSQTAWESVYYIQYEMTGGWLLRGIHHFTAHLMILLLVFHVVQVVIAGAYRAPREFNFWTGLILLKITLGLSLTGYLLPWDQKGYWATSVATNLMSLVPLVGDQLQQIVVGGSQYGHHTLTRFFALHAGILPFSLIVVTVLHLALFRKHGVTPPESDRPAQYFWPDQLLRDLIACLVVLVAVLLLSAGGWFQGPSTEAVPGDYLGAELAAPADPSESYAAARPEWYFLSLYELLKHFEGGSEVVGAIVLPGVAMLLLFLMPIVGRWQLGHRFNVAVLAGLLLAAVTLTGMALWADAHSPDFLAAVEQAESDAERIKQFIRHRGGIPPEGALALMRQDPEIQGPKLFAKNCQSCHSYLDAEGNGLAGPPKPESNDEPYGAPNLYGFASRDWIRGLLDPKRITDPEYFGATAHNDGEMALFVYDNLDDLEEDDQQMLNDLIAAVSAQARLFYQQQADQQAAQDGTIERGQEALVDRFACVDCHKFGEEGYLGSAPDLTGYGSVEWLMAMIADPEHERFYDGNNDRMPQFAANEEQPERNQLSELELRLLAQWLRRDLHDLP